MYRALIVHPDMNARSRIKAAAVQAQSIISCESISSLDDLVPRVRSEPFDIIFISHEYGTRDISIVIEKARETTVGDSCAFVLIAQPMNQTNSMVADGMIAGIHGFLCEPVSVDSVEEVSDVASGVLMQGTRFRLKAATGIVLAKIINENKKPSPDEKPKPLLYQVRNSYEKFRGMTGESLNSYVDAIVDGLYKLSPSERLGYDGVSQRVRKLFERRLLKRVEAAKEQAEQQ